MTIDTWVSLAALLSVLLSLGGLTLAMGQSLGAKIEGLRTELKGDIDGLRTELKGDIGRLDDRVYALAAGLRPLMEQAQSSADSTQ